MIRSGTVAAGTLAVACRGAASEPAESFRDKTLAAGSKPEGPGPTPSPTPSPVGAEHRAGDRWDEVRAQFDLDPEYAHFGGFLLASHPRPVREAIEGYRRQLDRNPVMTIEALMPERTVAVRAAAAKFLGARDDEVALTDSTTMGLGLVYRGFVLSEGQHILTTEYDHYSTHQALQFRAALDGALVRKVALFDHSAKASEAEIVQRLMAAVTEKTRLVAVTWVHSMSGLRLPIPAIAVALAKHNEGRAPADRAILSVDGVHGFGAIPVAVDDFGADLFIAGTHKWVFGPRGTGLVWGKPEVWANIVPVVPPFERPYYMAWMKGAVADSGPGGLSNTPGGFHSFEHRWALPAAFEFQETIGREDIAGRIHALNRQLKEGLAAMPKVELFTPMSDELSAGITCFMVEGMDPHAVVERLIEKKIIATTTPYVNTYARLAPGLLNTPAEVDRALAEIRALA